MDLDIFNKLINNAKENEHVQNFMKELTNYIENNGKENVISQHNKYSDYWDCQRFMEYNVAANIGISRWGADVKYRDKLDKAVDDSILKLAEKEGTLYRKQFTANGPTNNPTYNVERFENGNIEHIILSKDEVPSGFDDEDIIFQYKDDGSIEVRADLKKEAVEIASEDVKYLKSEENERASDYKREGHVYMAVEDDGYIFLKDLTEKRDYVLEDIDFVVDCYQGDGKYRVIDCQYQKIDE